MDTGKLNRILAAMKEQGHAADDYGSTDYFLADRKMIIPGERLLVLYLNENGDHKMLINELFPQEKDLGVELVYYNDIQDGVEILSKFVEKR